MGHGYFAECRLNDGRMLGNRLAGPGNLYGKVVILRRDFDLPRPEIHHGVIGAMMAELQLVGLQSKRESKNLMAKADAEYRSTADQPAHRLDRVGHRLGITRPVRKKNPIRLERFHLRGAGGGWHHVHVTPDVDEPT